ncbi:cation-translocating P-type ATPase [Acutalibacter caecimuris]|uniref:cation-translocating P-type ATPase n=1 Tax=Acutalibacter caecimuris TaxID=3093657 RepID=UPI002AC92698|nr:cation-translocating P-type ATPase [Acutalibacter sp. M00118]
MELHHLNRQQAAEALGANPDQGLSPAEAARRLNRHGPNQLRPAHRQGVLARFFSQFKDFMVLILLASAAVSFWASAMQGNGEYIDSIIILAIVVCNAVIGTVQELRADKAIDALKKLSSPHARVIRGGKRQTIDSAGLVPGDVVILRAGDMAPADLRLLSTVELRTEESALTGESAPVEKDAETVCAQNAPLAERRNTVFASTGIAAGAGVGLVCATGMDTAVGRIAGMLEEESSPETPLQRKLRQTGKVLGLGVVAICGAIFLLGLLQKIQPLEMFMIAISLGVAAIPEGLTAVVTIVLAMGVKRMAQKRAIVRHLPAVETLGSTQVICSDKTGTLTQNKMSVTAYSGAFGAEPLDSPAAQQALALATLCNNAELQGDTPAGDPTEAAFLRACRQKKPDLDRAYPRVGEIPFTSARKMMTTAHRTENGYRVISKGAPDVLLARCTRQMRGSSAVELTGAAKARLLADNARLAGRALRVLAVAYKDVPHLPGDDRQLESGLTFCGLIGMEDPPRPEARAAVLECKRAGVTPVMITGDHGATALAVARRIGIAGEHDQALTGPELDRLSESELAAQLQHCRVFARVSPQHKVKLVRAYQRRGLVVAMTGDGVNDAPALKAADIGCAMGKNGTEVAKSAADMVLTDDNFSTIVAAVREGRGIYNNIRKTIHFLLSCNIGEILVVFLAFLMRAPAPLLAIQLLWVNLVTDSLPALALGAEPIPRDVMEDPPHRRDESVFAGGMGFSVAVEGCLVGALALLAYTMGRVWFDPDPAQPVIGRTMAFAVLSLSQLVHSYNMRSPHSLWQVGPFSNARLNLACLVCALLMVSVILFPPLAAIFKTAALTPLQWLLVAGLSLCPLAAVEGEKLLLKKVPRKNPRPPKHP